MNLLRLVVLLFYKIPKPTSRNTKHPDCLVVLLIYKVLNPQTILLVSAATLSCLPHLLSVQISSTSIITNNISYIFLYTNEY